MVAVEPPFGKCHADLCLGSKSRSSGQPEAGHFRPRERIARRFRLPVRLGHHQVAVRGVAAFLSKADIPEFGFRLMRTRTDRRNAGVSAAAILQ
jgi:hypothetical protein